jgi:hypothetical protein
LSRQIAPYFSKVECFCFEEQKLLAGEEVDMPLLFFIDKDMLDDPACRGVDDVVLSYTFFRCVCASLALTTTDPSLAPVAMPVDNWNRTQPRRLSRCRSVLIPPRTAGVRLHSLEIVGALAPPVFTQ